jgi:AraC family transcriptional regulator
MAQSEAGRRLRAGEYFCRDATRHELDGLGLADLRYAEPRSLPEHAHESAYFSLLVRGAYRERIGSADLGYERLSVGFHPPGTCHRDAVGEAGTELFLVELPEPWLGRVRELAPRARFTAGVHRGEVARLARRLQLQAAASGPCARLAIEGLALEMVAEVGRVARSAPRAEPAWLARVEELLRATLGRGLSLHDLAREAGVHPVHLSRAFHRARGRTLGAHVAALRIEFALGELARDRASLGEIALLAGFADQSHFTRAFRRATGATPGAFRASLRSRSRRRDG